MSMAIIVQRVSSPVLSWTVIILSVSLLHLGSSTAASGTEGDATTVAGSEPRLRSASTIAHLSRRFDILLDELRQTSKKTRLAIEAAATFGGLGSDLFSSFSESGESAGRRQSRVARLVVDRGQKLSHFRGES